MGSDPINSIADLRELARRRLPRALYEYIERGSYDEFGRLREATMSSEP